MLCVKMFSFWLVGWLWRFWIHRPWHLQIYAHLQMVIEPYPPPPLPVSSSFVYLCRAHRKEEEAPVEPEEEAHSQVWLCLPCCFEPAAFGFRKVRVGLISLLKDVKTSALKESAGWLRMSQSFCVRSSRCMSSGQSLWHPSSIPSFPSCLLMMLIEQLL